MEPSGQYEEGVDFEEQWFRESAWIHKKDDDAFIKKLVEHMKRHFPDMRIWRNKYGAKEDYPMYLASMDPGVGGDTVHLWRDGQTWWPMTGDYSFDDENKIELELRRCIKEFLREKQR